jgi:hypothetical protein
VRKWLVVALAALSLATPSAAQANHEPGGGGGGMPCHSGVGYVQGWVYNYAYGRYMWHECVHIALWAHWHSNGPYWAGNYLGSGSWINGWMWRPL